MENQESKKLFLIENDSSQSVDLNPNAFYNVTLQANERIQKLVDEVLFSHFLCLLNQFLVKRRDKIKIRNKRR